MAGFVQHTALKLDAVIRDALCTNHALFNDCPLVASSTFFVCSSATYDNSIILVLVHIRYKLK